MITKSKLLPHLELIKIETSQNKHDSLSQEPKITPTLQDMVVLDLEDGRVATIPDVNEQWPTYLWEDVHNAKQGSNTYVLVPMEELELGHELPLDQESVYGVMGSVTSKSMPMRH